MGVSNIKYTNLRVEMARKKIGVIDMSSAIGMNRDTLSRKLSGKSPLYLDEAFEIQRTLFPNSSVPELFESTDST